MDMSTAIASVNFWAVLVAALASFIIGGLWYSPVLFYRSWMQAAGLTEAQMQSTHMGLVFGASFVLQVTAAFILAMFLGAKSDLAFGLTAGLMVGMAWIATAFGVVYLFERRPLKLFGINAGYQVVVYAVMGAILDAWH